MLDRKVCGTPNAPDHLRMTDELLAQVSHMFERAKDELLILLRSQLSTASLIAPSREWMSATQLAEYWQLYNEKNEPTTAGTSGPNDPQTSFRCHMRIWVIS